MMTGKSDSVPMWILLSDLVRSSEYHRTSLPNIFSLTVTFFMPRPQADAEPMTSAGWKPFRLTDRVKYSWMPLTSNWMPHSDSRPSPVTGLWFNLYGGYQDLKNNLASAGVSSYIVDTDNQSYLQLFQRNMHNIYAGAEVSYSYKDILSFFRLRCLPWLESCKGRRG